MHGSEISPHSPPVLVHGTECTEFGATSPGGHSLPVADMGALKRADPSHDQRGSPGTSTLPQPPPTRTASGRTPQTLALISQLVLALREAECELCMAQGADALLQEQLSHTVSACGLCGRACSPAAASDVCATLELRQVLYHRHALQASSASVNRLAASLSIFGPGLAQVSSSSRREFYARTGALQETRAQKQECLQTGECLACMRGFTGSELDAFLSRMDALNQARDAMLHAHMNYCV
jgi:hypothetical protein